MFEDPDVEMASLRLNAALGVMVAKQSDGRVLQRRTIRSRAVVRIADLQASEAGRDGGIKSVVRLVRALASGLRIEASDRLLPIMRLAGRLPTQSLQSSAAPSALSHRPISLAGKPESLAHARFE